MYSFIRLITYRNWLMTKGAMTHQRPIGTGRYRTGGSDETQKRNIRARLQHLEEMINMLVQNKIEKSVRSKCKHQDTSLPDCKPSRPRGGRLPVRPEGGRKRK
ncbi:unnamed protein product [Nezara viridula]|uniref:Uncharacterized protein n=1 Tax=Nezara viridula TaxID=85310 RepID=A0A9P0HSB0_NEZVI|nr:unnamed protein product [Nezara viridula]